MFLLVLLCLDLWEPVLCPLLELSFRLHWIKHKSKIEYEIVYELLFRTNFMIFWIQFEIVCNEMEQLTYLERS